MRHSRKYGRLGMMGCPHSQKRNGGLEMIELIHGFGMFCTTTTQTSDSFEFAKAEEFHLGFFLFLESQIAKST